MVKIEKAHTFSWSSCGSLFLFCLSLRDKCLHFCWVDAGGSPGMGEAGAAQDEKYKDGKVAHGFDCYSFQRL